MKDHFGTEVMELRGENAGCVLLPMGTDLLK